MSRLKQQMLFCIVLLSLLLLPVSSAAPFFMSKKMKDLHKIDPFSAQKTLDNETKYRAVIVQIADYQNDDMDLPIPEKRREDLYDALLQYPNWKRDNIRFIADEKATEENILQSLAWLAANSKQNDIALFAYSGHGSSIPDNNNDEKDGYDEGICPYDCTELTNDTLGHFITDDVLDAKLDKIQAEGICCIFDCCLSGGLVDPGTQSDESSSLKLFGKEMTTDVEGTGRVILMTSMDQGLGIALRGIGFPFTLSLVAGINHNRADQNNDHLISAEETFYFGKNLLKTSFILYLFGPAAMALLSEGVVDAVLTVSVSVLGVLIFEIIAKHQTGYWAVPIPTIYDGYEGELPLVTY